jgi:hypothetical protein
MIDEKVKKADTFNEKLEITLDTKNKSIRE